MDSVALAAAGALLKKKSRRPTVDAGNVSSLVAYSYCFNVSSLVVRARVTCLGPFGARLEK